MALQVFDYHTDIRNVFVTPQIRSRFLRMEPGTVAERHSHDLGHEIFLILEGNARFEISGEIAELGPGQMSAADNVAWACLAEDGAMSCGMVAALLEAPEDE